MVVRSKIKSFSQSQIKKAKAKEKISITINKIVKNLKSDAIELTENY